MINLNETFPNQVADFLHRYGSALEADPMHGLSRNRLWRIDFATNPVVVKVSTQEGRFYQHIAPHLVGIPIPQLLASFPIDDEIWLIMEFIPEPFPRSRWLADPEALVILYQLHQLSLGSIPDLPSLFRPGWDDSLSAKFLSFFEADSLAPLVTNLQAQAQHLFEPHCWISGDPNPANWGIRAESSLVLFDWERFGKGTPALDLAITVPGLGYANSFQAVVDQYAGFASVGDLALAKIWTVVEIFAAAYDGELGDMSLINSLIPIIPGWLNDIARLAES